MLQSLQMYFIWLLLLLLSSLFFFKSTLFKYIVLVEMITLTIISICLITTFANYTINLMIVVATLIVLAGCDLSLFAILIITAQLHQHLDEKLW